MKILSVIHGYPDYYMAGSEVYTHNICNELAKNHEVEVFTRYENPYEEPYTVLNDRYDGLNVMRVNKPTRDYTFRDKYLDPELDALFESKLVELDPDIVYIGHLTHLSTNIPLIAKKYSKPVVYTIHDFWLYCYRGQMITSDKRQCAGFSNKSCFECAKTSFKDKVNKAEIDEYRQHMDAVINAIDLFLAPSMTVYHYHKRNGVPESKLIVSKYGFDTERIKFQKKQYTSSQRIRFGYMGRVIPVKGMKTLFEAFAKNPNARLTIYGSQSDSKYLRLYKAENVTFSGNYNNSNVNDVLSEIDVLVVPSTWLENSPLVIQEAFLAGVPVITSDLGGMAELVDDNVDGYLFPAGNSEALAAIVSKINQNPALLNDLKPALHKVRTIKDDAASMTEEFQKLRMQKNYPWRITFDTNPGICNLRCQMCEVHSVFNPERHYNQPVMDFEIIRNIIEDGKEKGLREIIPSTMGEPLLYKDFKKIIQLAKEAEIKINLTTNGTFPGKPIEEWAEILLPVTSDIKVSQNELKKNYDIMNRSDPEVTTRNIKVLLSRRDAIRKSGRHSGTITVQVTFMDNNLAEIRNMIDFYGRLGVDRIKGHHIWVTWPQLAEQSLRRNNDSIKRWNDWVGSVRQSEYSHLLQNFDLIEQTNSAVTNQTVCPFLGKEAWIAADGTFNVCCIPSELRKDFGDFGNVIEVPFIELWNSDQYIEFQRNWGNYKHCNECNMRIKSGK